MRSELLGPGDWSLRQPRGLRYKNGRLTPSRPRQLDQPGRSQTICEKRLGDRKGQRKFVQVLRQSLYSLALGSRILVIPEAWPLTQPRRRPY